MLSRVWLENCQWQAGHAVNSSAAGVLHVVQQL